MNAQRGVHKSALCGVDSISIALRISQAEQSGGKDVVGCRCQALYHAVSGTFAAAHYSAAREGVDDVGRDSGSVANVQPRATKLVVILEMS